MPRPPTTEMPRPQGVVGRRVAGVGVGDDGNHVVAGVADRVVEHAPAARTAGDVDAVSQAALHHVAGDEEVLRAQQQDRRCRRARGECRARCAVGDDAVVADHRIAHGAVAAGLVGHDGDARMACRIAPAARGRRQRERGHGHVVGLHQQGLVVRLGGVQHRTIADQRRALASQLQAARHQIASRLEPQRLTAFQRIERTLQCRAVVRVVVRHGAEVACHSALLVGHRRGHGGAGLPRRRRGRRGGALRAIGAHDAPTHSERRQQ
jgi:hypothetical protein